MLYLTENTLYLYQKISKEKSLFILWRLKIAKIQYMNKHKYFYNVNASGTYSSHFSSKYEGSTRNAIIKIQRNKTWNFHVNVKCIPVSVEVTPQYHI
jgi:hypothetical protein